MDLEKNTLYREIIMEHYKNPQNSKLVNNLKVYSIKNPTCGDTISVQLDIKDDVILNIYQKSIGCSISTASSSIMSELLKNKTIKEAKKIIEEFYNMVKGNEYDEKLLEEATALSGVADYPSRFKCATATLEAILTAINEYEQNK